MLALALDMGGTHIGCGIAEDDELLASTSLDSEGAESLASLLPAIEATIEQLLRNAGKSLHECAGVAIGFPGVVDVRSGRIISTLKKYEDAAVLDLNRWAQETFAVRLRVENDARMALLGEQFAGAAKGCCDAAMVTLGTGIGGAAMMLGKLVRGKHSQAGCLGGHFPVDFRGRACVCGNIGCAEAEAAGWSLPGIIRSAPGYSESVLARMSTLNFEKLRAAADKKDRVAIAVWEHCLRVWAANAVALIHAYDPEVVVFGGGVMQCAEKILPHIQAHVDKHAWTTWGKPRIAAAQLGANAALLGAVPLLSEEL